LKETVLFKLKDTDSGDSKKNSTLRHRKTGMAKDNIDTRNDDPIDISSRSGVVRVTVHEAEVPQLKGITGQSSKYYVMVRLGVKTSYTDTVPHTDRPTFQQSFQFQCPGKFKECCLEITLKEGSANKCIGSREIPYSGNIKEEWLDLEMTTPMGSQECCRVRVSLEFRPDTPSRREHRRRKTPQPSPVYSYASRAKSPEQTGAQLALPTKKKKISELLLEIFTVVWIIALVYACLYTHFQYLVSSKAFFIMDPKDEKCLSWASSQAKFDGCKVFNGPTAVFSAVEGEDERAGLYKMVLNNKPSNETGACVGQKKDKMILEPCELARWEYTGVNFVHDGEYCLSRLKDSVRIRKCEDIPLEHTLKIVVIYDSGNTYIAGGLESLQKNSIELAELAALKFLQERWRKVQAFFFSSE